MSCMWGNKYNKMRLIRSNGVKCQSQVTLNRADTQGRKTQSFVHPNRTYRFKKKEKKENQRVNQLTLRFTWIKATKGLFDFWIQIRIQNESESKVNPTPNSDPSESEPRFTVNLDPDRIIE